MIQAVLFDFYETLVEIDKDTLSLWEVLRHLGFNGTPSLDEIWNSNAFDGMITPNGDQYSKWRFENITKMAEFAGVPKDALENVVHKMIEHDRTWTVKAKKCANQILKYLMSQNIPVAICTNWDYDIAEYVQQANLPHVDTIITSANIGVRKPHPFIFEYTCKVLNIQPSDRVFFVGDSWKADVIGALHVGLKPIWITQTNESPLEPHIIVQENLCACLSYFKNILRP